MFSSFMISYLGDNQLENFQNGWGLWGEGECGVRFKIEGQFFLPNNFFLTLDQIDLSAMSVLYKNA